MHVKKSVCCFERRPNKIKSAQNVVNRGIKLMKARVRKFHRRCRGIFFFFVEIEVKMVVHVKKASEDMRWQQRKACRGRKYI